MNLRTVLEIVSVVGIVAFVASILLVPHAVAKLPADHFRRPPAPHAAWVRVLRNIGGILLVVVGVALLVLPGQGVLTILLGLALTDLPAKRRVERWLVSRPPLWRALQSLRAKAHRPPLDPPDADDGHHREEATSG